VVAGVESGVGVGTGIPAQPLCRRRSTVLGVTGEALAAVPSRECGLCRFGFRGAAPEQHSGAGGAWPFILEADGGELGGSLLALAAGTRLELTRE
jgi:hypothetical protein